MSSLRQQLSAMKVVPRASWKHTTRDFLIMQTRQHTPVVVPLRKRLYTGIRLIPSFCIQLFRLPSNFDIRISNFIPVSRKVVYVPLSVFLLAVVGLGVTATAARSTVPGDVLYPVKLVSERVQISLTWQGKDRSKLKAEFATRRLDEISTLVKRPNVQKEHVEQAMTDFKDKVASAKQDLVAAKEEGNAHEVVEVAKILDTQTQEYEKKLGEVKNDLTPETKQELTATMNAALDAVEEVSVNSLTTLVEQADKDGITKEEVKQIIKDRVLSVPADPLVQSTATTQIDDKILEVKSYLAEDDLTKALGAMTETKSLVRKQEVDTSVHAEVQLPNVKDQVELQKVKLQPTTLQPATSTNDQSIVDKKQQEVDTSRGGSTSASQKDSESQNNTDPKASSQQLEASSPSDAPGALIIEEKD